MTSVVQTAAARQPFAPVDGSRLHRLTSTKNRQNGQNALLPTPTPTAVKRKAATFEADDDNSENIDPALFTSPKRVRGKDGLALTDCSKPATPHIVLTKAPSSQNEVATCDPVNSVISRPVLHPRSPASKLHPRSPASKLNTSTISSLSAPAGRSPTKKRVGILNRRRTALPLTRVDPHFATAPFSIDAALGGTIPSYRRRAREAKKILTSLHKPQMKASWFFDIHEDTVEETMTNLMEHSTCVLDISSDEESEARRRDRDDRGKENVPPTDDVSQASSRSVLPSMTYSHDGRSSVRAGLKRKGVEEDTIEVDRKPLGDLEPTDYYPEGYSEEDVFIVEDDEYELTPPEVRGALNIMARKYDVELAAQPLANTDYAIDGGMEIESGGNKGKAPAILDELMQGSSSTTGHAALFGPLEKAEEGFEIWESSSAKGEAEGDN